MIQKVMTSAIEVDPKKYFVAIFHIFTVQGVQQISACLLMKIKKK
jgi:hypothetical protein